MAIAAIVVLALADKIQGGNTPSFIYIGLMGAVLGAKWDDFSRFFGGGKR